MLGKSHWSPVVTDPRDFDALAERYQKEAQSGFAKKKEREKYWRHSTIPLHKTLAALPGIVPVWTDITEGSLGRVSFVVAVSEDGLKFLHGRFFQWKEETVYPDGYVDKNQIASVFPDLPDVTLSTTLLTRKHDEMLDDGRTFWIGWKWEAEFLNRHTAADTQKHIDWIMKNFVHTSR